mmetsp:Transcript_30082/g.77953  ORF Transcript_30082/g.77953 Transcript_30082/m.77953 type:complete len:248 (-) Transcript_30082:7-750(-)
MKSGSKSKRAPAGLAGMAPARRGLETSRHWMTRSSRVRPAAFARNFCNARTRRASSQSRPLPPPAKNSGETLAEASSSFLRLLPASSASSSGCFSLASAARPTEASASSAPVASASASGFTSSLGARSCPSGSLASARPTEASAPSALVASASASGIGSLASARPTEASAPSTRMASTPFSGCRAAVARSPTASAPASAPPEAMQLSVTTALPNPAVPEPLSSSPMPPVRLMGQQKAMEHSGSPTPL